MKEGCPKSDSLPWLFPQRCLFSVLGEDAFDLLGDETAVGLADCWPTRRHDSKRLTLPDHFLFEKSYNCIDIPIP